MKIASQAREMILIAASAVVVLPGLLSGLLSGVAVTRADEVAEVKPETREAEAKPDERPEDVERRQQLDLQIRQQAVHWEQQFKKLLHGDLELVRSVCGDLPRESRRAIVRAGEQAAKDASLRLAELQFRDQRRQPQVGFPWQGVVGDVLKKIVQPAAGPATTSGGGKPTDDPLTFFSAALAESLKEHVGSEQAEEFSRQLAARSERRKAATAHAIVAALDAELFLTAAQREAIKRSLLERWSDSMCLTLQGMHTNNGVRIFLGLPDECVRPHLTRTQRERFQRQPFLDDPSLQRQLMMQTLNMLNSAEVPKPDPWWAE
jgi:hypothetical protein